MNGLSSRPASSQSFGSPSILQHRANRRFKDWFESTYPVVGSISGRNAGREINARAEGDTFTALLTLKTNGRDQVFPMESPAAKVSEVSINRSQAPRWSQT